MVKPNSGIPISELSGSDAIDRLRETIIELNSATERQTTSLINLTKALVVMTVVLVVLTAVLVVTAP